MQSRIINSAMASRILSRLFAQVCGRPAVEIHWAGEPRVSKQRFRDRIDDRKLILRILFVYRGGHIVELDCMAYPIMAGSGNSERSLVRILAVITLA